LKGAYVSPAAHGLMFHRFHGFGERPSGQGSLSERELEAIVAFVGAPNILTPAEWMARLARGELQASDLCLSFDDGLMSQYQVALPVLEKHGLKAFWFIYSAVFEGRLDRNEITNYFAVRHFDSFGAYVAEFLGRCRADVRRGLRSPAYRRFAEDLRAKAPFYSEDDLAYRFVRNALLTREEFEAAVDAMIEAKGLSVADLGRRLWLRDQELRELHRAGHEIGLHSYDHPFALARLPTAAQREQYERNRDHIRRVTGAEVRSMSHPLNSYDEGTLALLGGLGIECGFRANMAPPPGKPLNPGPLELAREDGTNLRHQGNP
jgi:peptidoglycan/xylan/chitin deacetylase (PgdA/CDA1 family)